MTIAEAVSILEQLSDILCDLIIKKAQWKQIYHPSVDTKTFQCSNCSYELVMNDEKTNPVTECEWKYCPRCGCKMEAE